MPYCWRCLLFHWMRLANYVVSLMGIGIIIYSLWLLKIYNEELPHHDNAHLFPRPWFIYACLSVGLVVCLGSLIGHTVFGDLNMALFSTYIVSTFLVLLLQLAAIVAIYFKIDREEMITKYYADGENSKFVSFLTLHFRVCRFIAVAILLAQGNVLVLAIVLWAIRPQSRGHCQGPAAPEPSFIARPDSEQISPLSVPFVWRSDA